LDCAHATINGSQGKLSDHRVVQRAPSSHALPRSPTALSPETVFFSQLYRADDGPKQHAAVCLLQVNPRFASSSSSTVLAYIAHPCSSQVNSLQWSHVTRNFIVQPQSNCITYQLSRLFRSLRLSPALFVSSHWHKLWHKLAFQMTAQCL